MGLIPIILFFSRDKMRTPDKVDNEFMGYLYKYLQDKKDQGII